MRHVFVVFSGITRLSTLATIDTLRLDKSDVTILLGREQPPIDGFTCYAIRPVPMRLGRNFVRFRYQLRQFDAWIRELAQAQPLTVYLPGLFSEHLYALATDPAVVSVNLIEEGLSSLGRTTAYYSRRPNGRSSFASIGAIRRFPPHMTPSMKMLDKAYHFSPGAFPDWPEHRRVQLRWPSPPIASGIPSVIISVEAVIEKEPSLAMEYARILEEVAFRCFTTGNGSVAIKFHPNTFPANRAMLTQRLQSRFAELEVLPNEVTIEDSMGPNGPRIIGNTTAAMHYSILSGGTAATYSSMFASYEHACRFQKIMPPESKLYIERLL